jgi:hypothetical protein
MSTVFKPFGIVVGLLAGVVASKLFERLWSVIDDQQAPEPKYREIPLAKLVVALLLQGAISRLVRGMTDHGLRHGFARLTGEWPGAERPEDE